jgi:PAS domain S-box-containing protein
MNKDKSSHGQPNQQAKFKAAREQSELTQVNQSFSLHQPGEFLHELRAQKTGSETQGAEMRRTQSGLESSHAHYVELYDYAPIGYFPLNTDGLVTESNFTAAKLLGIERKNLTNRRFDRYIVESSKDTWKQQLIQTKRQGKKLIVELALCREDGTGFYAHLDCLHVETDDSPPQLRIMLREILDTKQADEALRIPAVAFETEEGVIVADANKVILRVNKAFTRITGYSAAEAVGRNPAFLRSGRHDRAFHEALWAAVEVDGFWQGEIWDKRKDGEIFPVWQTITAVVGTAGNITNYIGAITDISSQKQAEKAMLEARQHLENKVVAATLEMERIKQDAAKVNVAFNVLLNLKETDKAAAQNALSAEFDATILPLMKQLKINQAGRLHTIRLFSLLENNLQLLMQSYGRAADLAAAFQKLTPIEAQVASMIRQGLPTKGIATALNRSPGTISIHRKNIRKKFDLDGKPSNLHSYLVSLAE